MPQKHTNRLIHETSPYLLQHAHNPVDWFPWGDEALEKAKAENKLILVSIGYSACHWCHVMEHESFENEEIAEVMNKAYVSIKVDREERPDIDQIYMEAIQLMTGSGGWPLNCFLLPDGRPVYGGTYFRPGEWRNVLESLNRTYQSEPHRVVEYAQKLEQGMNRGDLFSNAKTNEFKQSFLTGLVSSWKNSFDKEDGGNGSAPKFPMPNSLQFLLRHYYHTKDKEVLQHINLTLTKMAEGGIYDQLSGGFARYSVDAQWKVPHFEKMLYDNAQLVSLYSEAFQLTKYPLYKEVVYDTLAFVERELTSPEGGFYCALDADSEGVEGKFYVWEKDEIETVLGADAPLFIDYFRIGKEGSWEGKNILLVKEKQDVFAFRHNLSEEAWRSKLQQMKQKLMIERDKRIRPGLDDKILTSWNALMIKGYVDAYRAFGEKSFLDAAIKNANHILHNCMKENGQLFRSYKNGDARISAFLDDYSLTIEAMFSLFQGTLYESWLLQAKRLTEYVMAHFYDEKSGMFFYTSDEDPKLINRKMELSDNVIPASNSSMAKALSLASFYFENEKYGDMSRMMLSNMLPQIEHDARYYSNWCSLMYGYVKGVNEVVICGEKANEFLNQFNQHFLPNAIFAGTSTGSGMSIFEGRFVSGETTIYVCQDRVCKLPVKEVDVAIKQIIEN
ncbi:MAG: thioredoxin domain-containing protein [Bacteroidales bacterium]|nr:thioredoxin domain-containing protein [Bacteroidales bacterium]MCF8455322.1 thioredoxin domain-containing protein [Bacteroidales bacterium]